MNYQTLEKRIMKIYNKIPYPIEGCEQNEPSLELYLTDTDNDTLMLIYPGGGYAILADHEGKGYAEYFNSLGLNCAVLNYRLAPYSYPCQALDARRAVRFIKAHADEYKINPDKIVVVGSSAGGHLAAMTALFDSTEKIDKAEGIDEIDLISPKIAGLVLCYPVITLGKYTHEGSRDNLTKGDKDLIEHLSIEKAAGSNMPPAFIWTTLDDNLVDSRNSLYLAERYHELGLDCELHIFPHGHHGLGLAPELPHVAQWTVLCKNWMISHGFLK